VSEVFDGALGEVFYGIFVGDIRRHNECAGMGAAFRGGLAQGVFAPRRQYDTRSATSKFPRRRASDAAGRTRDDNHLIAQ
jgi:hypothetical protein